jgi:hypothetical protein
VALSGRRGRTLGHLLLEAAVSAPIRPKNGAWSDAEFAEILQDGAVLTLPILGRSVLEHSRRGPEKVASDVLDLLPPATPSASAQADSLHNGRNDGRAMNLHEAVACALTENDAAGQEPGNQSSIRMRVRRGTDRREEPS